jgi:methylmalonyl-CoA mutase N-terminal domain/subunit
VADSVDPLAGSYLIETLTDEIEKNAEDYIAKIDDMGGALQAIEKGFMQNEIQNAAYAAQQAIERGEQVIVGVNQFKVQEELTLDRLKVDPAIELGQKAKLKQLRETRDQRVVEQLLDKLQAAAEGTENLMPLFVECVENDITLGEICNTLRVIWGEYVAEGF